MRPYPLAGKLTYICAIVLIACAILKAANAVYGIGHLIPLIDELSGNRTAAELFELGIAVAFGFGLIGLRRSIN